MCKYNKTVNFRMQSFASWLLRTRMHWKEMVSVLCIWLIQPKLYNRITLYGSECNPIRTTVWWKKEENRSCFTSQSLVFGSLASFRQVLRWKRIFHQSVCVCVCVDFRMVLPSHHVIDPFLFPHFMVHSIALVLARSFTFIELNKHRTLIIT